MSYTFYSFLHIFSIITAVVSLAMLIPHFINGGTKENLPIRKQLAKIHGISLVVAFVAGFGLMAKAGYNFTDSKWLYVKILCWFLLGAFPVLVFKKVLPKWAAVAGLLAVVALAVFAVTYKPF